MIYHADREKNDSSKEQMMMPEHFPQDPKSIWSQFYQITRIPRPSKKEELFRQYILDLAQEHQLSTKSDETGNIVIYVPGTEGKENNDPVIIQNHMDMVTDHAPGKEINFETDPIETFVDQGWLKADRTTLGADNGIGCAAALATITDTDIAHPPLELLFTTDEETGLNGAWGVDKTFFKGRVMLNLDTEEWGSLYIGCAGGIDYEINGEFELTSPESKNYYQIDLTGLVGGHSGLDIHLQRANAIQVVSNLLARFANESILEIADFRIGRAHNIIPRDGFATFSSNLNKNELDSITTIYKKELLGYLGSEDGELNFEIKEINSLEKTLNSGDSSKFLSYLSLFPHGAHSYDLEAAETLVAVSNNLAVVILKEGKLYTLTSLRFFDRPQITALESQICSLANIFGFKVEKNSEYPSWKPARKSELLDLVSAVYEKEFKAKAEIKAIHAGLECGILKDRIGELDVISFGPTIMGAHSPDERIKIDTVKDFWKLFKAVLKEL